VAEMFGEGLFGEVDLFVDFNTVTMPPSGGCRRARSRINRVDLQVPSDPLADNAWILLLQRIYGDSTDSREDHVNHKDLEEGAKKKQLTRQWPKWSGNGGVGNVTIFEETICE
jgi:hypothetical protein